MKNESHPLIQALSKGKATPPSIEFQNVPSRQLEVHHSEIPGLPGKQPGEHITVSVQGHISHHDNGKSVMEIHHIAPDSPTKESTGSPEAMRVIPPNSPEPS